MRGLAPPMAKAFSTPSAVSISGWIFILSCGRPCLSSIRSTASTTRWTSSGRSIFGKRIADGCSGTIASMSAMPNGVSRWLTRTVTSVAPKSIDFITEATSSRAASFCVAATESSRSSSTLSAPKIGPFWSIPGLLPGM